MSIKPGQLYMTIRSFYSTYDFSIVKSGSIALVIDTDNSGNVYYLLEERKTAVDYKTFSSMFERIEQ
jgi:hypothetical protein